MSFLVEWWARQRQADAARRAREAYSASHPSALMVGACTDHCGFDMDKLRVHVHRVMAPKKAASK